MPYSKLMHRHYWSWHTQNIDNSFIIILKCFKENVVTKLMHEPNVAAKI